MWLFFKLSSFPPIGPCRIVPSRSLGTGGSLPVNGVRWAGSEFPHLVRTGVFREGSAFPSPIEAWSGRTHPNLVPFPPKAIHPVFG